MLMVFTMLASCVMVFLLSSFHSLSYLLFMEALVLVSVSLIIMSSNHWIMSMFFLVISVCMGAYGMSLFITLDRSKGFSYFFSF